MLIFLVDGLNVRRLVCCTQPFIQHSKTLDRGLWRPVQDIAVADGRKRLCTLCLPSLKLLLPRFHGSQRMQRRPLCTRLVGTACSRQSGSQLSLTCFMKRRRRAKASSRQKSTQNWQISALHSHVQLPLACLWQQQSSVAPSQLSPKSPGGSQSVEGPIWPWSETSQEAVSERV